MRSTKIAAVAFLGLFPSMSATSQTAPPAPDAATLAYQSLPDTPGSGPFPTMKEEIASFPGHVIYRPANLSKLRKRKLGVIAWGNGGCSDNGASARLHLLELASRGYLVIAPGRILTGPGAPAAVPATPRRPDEASGQLPPVATKGNALLAPIDWAVAENNRAGSPFKGRLDPKRIAVAGHSCGGLQALIAASDPRVSAVIVHNSGIFADGSNPISGIEVNKAMLAKLHTPVLYILGGPTDVAYPNGMDDFDKINHVPVAVADLAVGHGGTFRDTNGGRAATVAVAWLDWQLSANRKASRMFKGKNCGLCTDPDWKFTRKKIK